MEMHQPFIRESFLPNDVGTIYFLVPASFRGKTRPHEGGRDEKSGSVFLGEVSMILVMISEQSFVASVEFF